MTLDQLYTAAAKQALADGVAIDGNPGGAVHQWAARNVSYRPETAFFVIAGITAAMADIDAQAEGFENQLDRAARRAFA